MRDHKAIFGWLFLLNEGELSPTQWVKRVVVTGA